jgi:hypothetical protein
MCHIARHVYITVDTVFEKIKFEVIINFKVRFCAQDVCHPMQSEASEVQIHRRI